MMTPSQPSLPTNRVFVVQFRPPSTCTSARCSYSGRVEHLVSGEVVRFHSPEALLAFMRRVLSEVQHDEQWGTREGRNPEE
jgi:hypothetical protein